VESGHCGGINFSQSAEIGLDFYDHATTRGATVKWSRQANSVHPTWSGIHSKKF